MRHHLSLYRRLLGVQVRSQLQYPTAFLLEVFGNAVTLGTYFLSLALIMQRFERLGGWTLGEIAFLYGMAELGFGTMDLIFSGFDPSFFGRRVRRGTFDQMLLRPVNITLQVLTDDFQLRRLGRMSQGFAVLLLATNLADIQWTAGKLLYLPLVLAGIVAFFGGLFVIGSTITFWTVESVEVINIFTYGGNELISYPLSIYPDWLRGFFTYILPAAFINYYPALYFLDKADPFGLPEVAKYLAPVAGFLVLGVALRFWQVGVRHYQSTGS
jgi:ABC-2 type transport system permease protein